MLRPLDELINDGTDISTMEDKDFIIAVLEEYVYFANITVSKKAIEAMQTVLKTIGGYDMEASIMELQDELQYLIMCCGVEKFRIEEIRENIDEPVEYVVTGLEIEVEQGIVLMTDIDNVIQGSLAQRKPYLTTAFPVEDLYISKVNGEYLINLPGNLITITPLA
jgi:hypothetical protein